MFNLVPRNSSAFSRPSFGSFERIFDDPFFAVENWAGPWNSAAQRSAPRTTLRQEKDRDIVQMEVPGYTADELNVSLEDNNLIVSGERKENGEGQKGLRFSQTLRMPEKVDPSAVTAKLKDGILSLDLPKDPKQLPRSIEVKAG